MLTAIACTSTVEDEIQSNNITHKLPNEIIVSMQENLSRIQLDEQCRTTWTEDDELSVFYFSDANNRFLFMGDTGDRNGALVVEDNRMGDATAEIDQIVLVYPYSSKYKLNPTTKSIGITIPGTQYYLNGSYGVGANIMTSVDTTNDFALKSVCGWIKVQLTGAASVTKVTLTGNSKEQLAGDATLYYEENRLALLGEDGGPDDSSQVGGTLFFGEYVRTITLDCGEGVALDSTTPTEFYFVLAPQTFDKGITIEATLSNGSTITKSTSKSIIIERNVITPMASFDVQPSNEIWYTSTDGNIVKPNSEGVDIFGANIVSNTYENGKGVIKFDEKVTKIGVSTFEDCNNLANITIPNSVNSIGEDAFRESSISSIIIPTTVSLIGSGSFAYCSNLTNVIITGNGITSIGSYAFQQCLNLTNITICNGVSTIEPYAFSKCSSLTKITIPDSVTSIGEYAFWDCPNLTNVAIGNGITSLDPYIFKNCTSLAKFEGGFASNDGRCWIVDGELNCFAPAGLTKYTLPDNITSIGNRVFYECATIVNVTIPDSVISIGEDTFSRCTNLSSIFIPDNVISIGESAFADCTNLSSTTIGKGVTSIGDSAFSNCSGQLIINSKLIETDYSYDDNPSNGWLFGEKFSSIVIGDNVTEIGDYVFKMCEDVVSISISDSVTTIGNGSFFQCKSLTNIHIPDSVTIIGEMAFSSCINLSDITIGNGVSTIEPYAFSSCNNLVSISIPDNVTSIGEGAFYVCKNLTNVIIGSGITSIERCAFHGCENLGSLYCEQETPPAIGELNLKEGLVIYVPTESVEAYKATDGWKEYADAIEPYVF